MVMTPVTLLDLLEVVKGYEKNKGKKFFSVYRRENPLDKYNIDSIHSIIQLTTMTYLNPPEATLTDDHQARTTESLGELKKETDNFLSGKGHFSSASSILVPLDYYENIISICDQMFDSQNSPLFEIIRNKIKSIQSTMSAEIQKAADLFEQLNPQGYTEEAPKKDQLSPALIQTFQSCIRAFIFKRDKKEEKNQEISIGGDDITDFTVYFFSYILGIPKVDSHNYDQIFQQLEQTSIFGIFRDFLKALDAICNRSKDVFSILELIHYPYGDNYFATLLLSAVTAALYPYIPIIEEPMGGAQFMS